MSYVLCFVSLLYIVFYFDLHLLSFVFLFFFFKQKTAYEMRISDWSSDVCSSDLVMPPRELHEPDLLWVQRRTQRIIFLDAVDTQRMARIEFLHFRCDRQEVGRASCRERVCQYV